MRLSRVLLAILLVCTTSLVAISVPVGVADAALTPPSPPPPKNPPPSIKEVSTPGPTRVGPGSGYQKAKDMVWGPIGSPYIVTNDFAISAQESLTILPGTVVKFEVSTQEYSRFSFANQGTLYVLGTPDKRVTFTSIRDDSVGGDTNGDGSATAPARGDWYQITNGFPGAVGYLKYVDLKYGGWYPQPYCHGGGAISGSNDTQLVISNARISHSLTSGAYSTTLTGGYFGLFDSEVDYSACGLTVGMSEGTVIASGNTFKAGIDKFALEAGHNSDLTFTHNVAHRPVTVNSVAAGGRTDVRFNSTLGGFESGNAIANWYGRDINREILPTCMTQEQMDAYVPRLRMKNIIGPCPSGSYEPEWANPSVIPALTGAPGGIPQAIHEMSAPRFDGVDTYRGALRYQADDLIVQDAGKTLTANRTYQSHRPGDGGTGKGWSASYAESMSTLDGSSVLTLSDGSALPFVTDPAAGYVPAGGVVADFSSGPAGSSVTAADLTTFEFDPAGELTGLILGDPGHRVAVERSGGKPAKLTGVSGRYLRFERVSGKLARVTDSQGRSAELSYVDGRLASVSGVDGRSERYDYDSDGRLTRVTAPSGVIKLAAGYRSDGKVEWVELAGKGRNTFSYDPGNRRTTITRADNTRVVQHYDAHGRLSSEEVVGGAATHVFYDGAGRSVARVDAVPSTAMDGHQPVGTAALADHRGDIVAIVDPLRTVAWTRFNGKHRPMATTHADGGVVTRTYDTAGRLATVTDQLGKTWSYTFNGRGQVLTQTNPLQQTRTLTYEADGDLATVRDPFGATTMFEYDDLGRRVTATDSSGHRHRTTYTAWGEVLSVTAPSGAVNAREFNVDRQLAAVVDPLDRRTTFEYDTSGRPSAMVDALQRRATVEYDALGRPNRQVDVAGAVTLTGYTVEGFVSSTTDASGAVTTIANDPAGRPYRVTDPLGQVTQYGYFPTGKPAKLERPDGSARQYTLDRMGRIASDRSPMGNVFGYAYDRAGHLTKVTDPLNNTRLWAYDDLGRVSVATDELGRTTQTAYDDAGRKVTVTDSLGTASVTRYDAHGNIVSTVDGSGRSTGYEYDSDGRLSAVVAPGGGRSTYGYDSAGRVTSFTDPLNRATGFSVDELGRTTRVTDPAGNATRYTYNAGGQVETVTDRTDRTVRYGYDALGLLRTVTDPAAKVTSLDRDVLGRVTRITDPTGVQHHRAYDPVGRVAVEWDAAGASHVTKYDLDGNVDERIEPSGVKWSYAYNGRGDLKTVERNWFLRTWSYTYDKAGNLETATRPGGTAERFGYDQRARITSHTGEDGKTTGYGFDGAGRQTSVTLPSGASTSWTYDGAGRMATAVDGLGHTARYEHDAAGQLKKVTLPRGGVYEYTFHAIGVAATVTDPNGKLTRYSYDEEGRPTRTQTPAGRVLTARYDTVGRLWQSEAGGRVRTLSYDDAGRLASAHVDGQPDAAFTYDNRGLMATSTDRAGKTTFAYDDFGRLSKLTPPSGTPTTYTYFSNYYDDGHGRLETVRGAINANYSYHPDGRLRQRRFMHPSAAQTDDYNLTAGRLSSVGALTYTYDQDGRIESAAESVPEGKKTSYGYDNAGHLTSKRVTQGEATLSSTTYGWDEDGNRTSVTEGEGQPLTFNYDLAGQLLSSSDGATYTHDDDGNQTNIGSKTLTYNDFGELTGVGSVALSRDGLGRVSAREADGTTQTYGYFGASQHPAATRTGDGPLTNVVLGAGGQLLGEATAGGASLRATVNIHRDVIGWKHDASGTEAATVAYDPFGAIQASTGEAAPLALGYQGSPTEASSGLVDMGARAYDPATAHFTAADSLSGVYGKPVSLNRYAYGNGDPVNHIDPDGHWPQLLDDFIDWWKSGWDKGMASSGKSSDPIGRFLSSAVTELGSGIADTFRTAGVGVRCAKADQASCDALKGIFTWETVKNMWRDTVNPIKQAWRSGKAEDWGVAAAGVLGLFFGRKLPKLEAPGDAPDAPKVDAPHVERDADGEEMVDVYRWGEKAKLKDWIPRIDWPEADPIHRQRMLDKMRDPEQKQREVNRHAMFSGPESPFMSVVLDPTKAIHTPDLKLRSIIAHSDTLGHFRVPKSRLHTPDHDEEGNSYSRQETELLFEGRVINYLVEFRPNPYLNPEAPRYEDD